MQCLTKFLVYFSHRLRNYNTGITLDKKIKQNDLWSLNYRKDSIVRLLGRKFCHIHQLPCYLLLDVVLFRKHFYV